MFRKVMQLIAVNIFKSPNEYYQKNSKKKSNHKMAFYLAMSLPCLNKQNLYR